MAQPDALDVSGYSKQELRKLARLLKDMGDDAQAEAQGIGVELANFGLSKIKQAAGIQGKAAKRIAEGGRVRKKSKLAEIAFGFASQRFSGGGTTQINGRDGGPGVLAGYEFGSNKYPGYPKWSGVSPTGRGSRGYFIYPTLRAIQPSIVDEWTRSLDSVIRKWS